jgi:transcriptional regulator with XRE-family HTH domain
MSSKPGSNPDTQLGSSLRRWRSVRGKSQLDLALEAGVSQRYLSFVESGRSTPGRQKLLDLAEALDVPFRDRNALLLAAGYAPIYAEGAWNEPQMRSITNAVERMLRQQEPYPAILMDRYWNVLATNDAAPHFFGQFVDLAARKSPRNVLHLMFDPAGMRPFIRDWDRVARSLIERVYREAVGRIIDDRTRELLDTLAAYEGSGAEGAGSGEPLPMIPLSFEKNGVVLNYFSIISTVGTPTTISAQELRLECMFPLDEATEQRHQALLSRGTAASGST